MYAPASTSCLTISKLPFFAATCRGLTNCALTFLGSAPFSNNILETKEKLFATAKNNGVCFLSFLTLGSALFLSKTSAVT